MESINIRIGLALGKENYIWIKQVLSEKFQDISFYHIKYDLHSENLYSKIDFLIMDLGFPENSVFKRKRVKLNIPFIVFIENVNQKNLITAIESHPFDIWIKGSTSKNRIYNSISELIEMENRNEELCKFKQTMSHLPISVVISDNTGKIEYVNPQFEKVSGYSLSELIDKNPRVLKSGVHDSDFYKEMWDTITHGYTWEGEIYNKNKNGELYLERLMIFAYKNKQDQITHYIGIRVDDMDRRRAEALKNIKELAGGIAHEFSQPLQVISISLGMLETKLRGNDLFARIKRMVDKIIDLVSNLKNITELKQQDYLDIQILDLKASSKLKTKSDEPVK